MYDLIYCSYMVSNVIWHQFKYAWPWERYRYRVLGQKIAKYIEMKSYQRKGNGKYTRDCSVSCHSQQRAFPTAVTCHTILHIYSSLAGTYKQQHRRNKRATIEYQKVNAFLVSHLRVRFFHSSFLRAWSIYLDINTTKDVKFLNSYIPKCLFIESESTHKEEHGCFAFVSS